MPLTNGDLFAGIGCFSYGLAQAGIETVFHVEIDPTCRSALRRHAPDHLIVDDIRDCGAHNLPHVDILTFGSPCQDMSIAGKRAGLGGQRSGLFFEAIRLCAELTPTFAIWENVPGALSSHAGRDFAAVLCAFRDCGARDIAWRVFDAQYFGLAQRRERVFLVADFRGDRAGQVLFESESLPWHPPARREAGQDLAAALTSGSHPGSNAPGRHREDDINLVPSVASTLGSNASGGPRGDLDSAGAYIPTLAYALTTKATPDRPESRAATLVTHALTSEGADASEDGTGRGVPLTIAFQERGRADGPHMESQDDLAYALTAPAGGGRAQERTIAGVWGVRRLTPTECEKLQGLPVGWTAYGAKGVPISDSARYRMIGNGGAVPILTWIGRRLLAAAASSEVP